MNRRTFFKAVTGLAASIALPVEAIAKVIPTTWAISPVRWVKQFDLRRDAWIFRADVFVGPKVDETTDSITIDSPVQLGVDILSPTEELHEESKKVALEVLMASARDAALKMK